MASLNGIGQVVTVEFFSDAGVVDHLQLIIPPSIKDLPILFCANIKKNHIIMQNNGGPQCEGAFLV